MDGLSRPSGSGVPITVEGKTLYLAPLVLSDLGEMENHLLAEKQKRNPFAELRKELAGTPDMPDGDREFLLTLAYQDHKRKNFVALGEMQDWMDSREGMIYSLWICLRKNYPEDFKTLEQAAEFFDRVTEDQFEQFKQLRDVAAGLDELGNSTGRDETVEKETPEDSESPGEKSSDDSSRPTADGPSTTSPE